MLFERALHDTSTMNTSLWLLQGRWTLCMSQVHTCPVRWRLSAFLHCGVLVKPKGCGVQGKGLLQHLIQCSMVDL